VVFAILIASELSAQVVIRLVVWVLEIVFSVRGRLPDIHDGIRDALSSKHIGDFAVHKRRVSAWGRILDNAGAELAEGGVG
jgi:hypothetical protein